MFQKLEVELEKYSTELESYGMHAPSFLDSYHAAQQSARYLQIHSHTFMERQEIEHLVVLAMKSTVYHPEDVISVAEARLPALYAKL